MEPRIKHITDRSRDIFMKYGIRSVSMDDISRELGMSKKTLYQFFSNKSDLIGEVLGQDFHNFESKLQSVMHLDNNAIDDLLALSMVIDEHMKEINPVVSFDLKKYYPEIYRENLEKKRVFASAYLKENIEKGIRENIYRSDLNIELIAKLYMRKIEDLHDPDFHDMNKTSFAEVFHVMFDNHIRGIANENGIRYFEERKKTLKLNW